MSEDTDFCNLGETYQTNLEDNYWRLLQKTRVDAEIDS